MTQDMTRKMNMTYKSKKQVTRLMAGSSHTLAILMSKLRVWLEAAWSMPRVCLEYAYTHLIRKPYAISVRARRTASPLLTDRESAAYGLFLTLLLLISGVVGSWGQTDYSGIYFIANGKQLENSNKYYDKNDPSVNFYLCPAQYYYNPEGSGTGVVSTTNNTGKPFLTTYKTNQGDNSIWLIEKVENKSTYYIKYIGVGDDHDKYVIMNPSLKSNFPSGVDDTRLRVHLEEKAKSELNTDAEFEIIQYGSDDNIYYGIRISTIPNGWLNPSKGNKEAYIPNGTGYIGGIIGYYKDKTPDVSGGEGSKWYLEKVPPVISYNSSNLMEISYIDASYTIYYSYGEESTPSPSSEGTFSYNETGPFDPPAGTTTIKAIAIKDGKESGVATFTPPCLLGSTHKYLIQSQGNGWTTGDFQGNYFYMIPGDEDNNGKTKVNTTSMFRPSMQWYILHAGTTDDVTYYYIVNNDNRRIRYDSTNGIYLDTWDESSANEFKFRIVETATAGTYNIIPYGVTDAKKYFNKTSGNASDAALTLYNNATDGNSRWKFVKKDALVETAPFTVTENNSITYYKLQNKATSYYVAPPSFTGGAVTASNNSTDADVVNSRNWYFEVAQESSDADWLTWYYIRNAITGDYLYYSGPETSNDAAAFITKGSLNETDENDMKRYRFTWARSITVDNYFIVPQLLKDETQNTISGLNRNNTTLKIYKSKSSDGSLWQFVAPDYTVAPPNIVYNAEVNTVSLSCTTPGATIYYTTNNTEATTTSGNSGTSIDLKAEGKENVTIIRAIAEVSGTSSLEATNNIIVQATVGNVKRPYLIRNNQSSWTVGGEPMFVYYMIPSDVVSGNTTVNTTSMPRPTMEWYFEHAGKADGKQYYYIVNASTGDYLYRTTGNAIYMKTSSERTTLEAASDNGFKFYLIPRAAGTYYSGYSIVPYGETARYLNKSNGNEKADAINAGTNENNHSRWNFVTKTDLTNDLAAKLPFTPSSGSSSTYYKIENGNTSGGNYYVIPPASESGNATASISEEAAIVKSGSWYFVQVEAPTDTDWLTYYKIINAETGKALYYAYTNNSSNCLKVGDYDESNDNYKFAFVKSPTTDYYYIVPKAVKDNQLANISTFWRDGSNIKPATTRGTSNNVWTFTTATLFCNNPVFVEEDGKIKIICNTNAAKIYYTTNGTEPASTEFTEETDLSASTKYLVKAKAVVNEVSSQTVTLLNRPDISLTTSSYEYDGTAKTFDKSNIEKVFIKINEVETAADATAYDVDGFENNIHAATSSDANPPTVTLKDIVDGDVWYVWNASTAFTISPKPITITAGSDSKVYDGTALTKDSYTSTALADGDKITSVTVTGSQTDVGESGNVPSAAVIKNGSGEGEDVTTDYNITYVNGTLEVTAATVTVTADDKTKVYFATDPELTVTMTGLKNNEAESVISYTISRAEGENIGGYAITPTGDATQGNYNVTYVPGTLTINPKAVTITANDASKDYDGTALTESGFTATPLEEGDTHTFTVTMTAESTITDAGTQPNVIATVDGVAVTTGTATAVGNYSVTTVNGTLTINGIAATITSENSTKVYGDADPGFTWTVTGLQGSDTKALFTVGFTRETGEDVNADGYTITPTGDAIQGNYSVTYVAEGKLTITQAPVDVTAKNMTKGYGDPDPTFTATVAGLKNGDAESVITYSISRTQDGETVTGGPYTITPTGASSQENYTVAYHSGTLTIEPKSLGSGTVLAPGISIDISKTNDIYDVTVTQNGNTTLVQGADKDYIWEGTGTDTYVVTVTGKGNYTGSAQATFINLDFYGTSQGEGTSTQGQTETAAAYCATGNLQATGGVKAYTVTAVDVENNIVYITEIKAGEVNYIPQNVPVLLLGDDTTEGFTLKPYNGTTVPIGEENLLKQSDGNVAVTTPDYYIFYEGAFVLSMWGEGKKIKEDKFYVHPTESGSSPAPAYAGLRLVKDGTTMVDAIVDNSDLSTWQHPEEWYTLDGQKLNKKPTRKGLYILNGQKVVIK